MWQKLSIRSSDHGLLFEQGFGGRQNVARNDLLAHGSWMEGGRIGVQFCLLDDGEPIHPRFGRTPSMIRKRLLKVDERQILAFERLNGVSNEGVKRPIEVVEILQLRLRQVPCIGAGLVARRERNVIVGKEDLRYLRRLRGPTASLDGSDQL